MSNLDRITLPDGLELYDWQKNFLNNHDSDRVLLCAEAGTGKTISAICWLKLRPHARALVIVPKSTILKWQQELVKWEVEADVISTDGIKKIDLNQYQAVIVDECQNFCSALFDKSRSARATVLYNYVKNNPDAMVFLASATPIRSKPENLHTLLCYLGIYWDIRKFREEFLHLTNKFGRLHYEPNKDWRIKIRPHLEKYAHIVLMADQVDVPTHTHTVTRAKWTPKHEKDLKEQHYEEVAQEWHTRHRAEQGEHKWKALRPILDGNRKVVVVCYYLDQIEDYAKRIGQDRLVYVLNGSTKDQGQVIEDANNSDDCILLVQAGIGAGFDLDKFSVMVFASMSFAFVHLVQMQARINRIHNLHANRYIYLLGGKCDEAVYAQVDKGFDFHPPAYYSKEHDGQSSGSTEETGQEGGESNADGVSVVSEELPF